MSRYSLLVLPRPPRGFRKLLRLGVPVLVVVTAWMATSAWAEPISGGVAEEPTVSETPAAISESEALQREALAVSDQLSRALPENEAVSLADTLARILDRLVVLDPGSEANGFADRSARATLNRVSRLPVESESRLLEHLRFGRVPGTNEDWAERRSRDTRLWLRAWQRFLAESGGTGAPNRPPTVGRVSFPETAEIALVEAYGTPPYATAELEEYLKEYGIDPATRERMLLTVMEIIG